MMPPKSLTIVKLSDHFGDYTIILRCESCGHVRRTAPHPLAAFTSWDAKLEDVVKRLRCSACQKRACSATVHPATKRDYR